jgi:preprotein translocase subunit SecA
MRKLARELEISFNPEDPANTSRLLELLDLEESDAPRLNAALQGGISHQVLNARKHTEESQIIAGAGAFGAVTIATNMAGRGVDIKLGGELPEQVISVINRILRRSGYSDPYEMSMQERREALQKLAPSDYGIYETEVQVFLQYMHDMERVRQLGGLHIVGSERHEARRIDNQLRGRSARQGDPGSSRFYLSMEDDLMRLFGGQQADNLMQRMKIDDALPLEMGLVSRIVEQSQTRVEGANFDVRKHLLEYDDVLNTQRAKIYGQRNRIFTKEDLSEDVTEMLRAEVNRRVPEALADAEGPWKLLAWLEQIQPPLQFGNQYFPSFLLRLILQKLMEGQQNGMEPREAVRALLNLSDESLQAEEEHLLHAVHALLEGAEIRLEDQLRERLDAVDTFFEGLSMADETEQINPRQVIEELSATARLPLRLSSEQGRLLRDDPQELKGVVNDQIRASLYSQSISRLVGSVERRLEESLNLDPAQLQAEDWDTLSDQLLAATQAAFEQRRSRLLGESGQIARDLEGALGRADGRLGSNALLQLLMLLPQGSRAAFDKKTHRRVVQRTTRFTYLYYAARLLEGREPGEITEEVLNHLERAQAAIRQAWGEIEWNRIATSSLTELDSTTRRGLREVLTEETCERVQKEPLQSIPREEILQVIPELGRQALTEIYRQLLLGVITELWVDYLTQMEALRVSIGLEAYAQRDPLVQYKNRASGLFQDLLDNMRSGVVTRMFTYRPRDLSSVQTTVTRQEAPPEEVAIPENGKEVKSNETQREETGTKNKRRRRRRR